MVVGGGWEVEMMSSKPTQPMLLQLDVHVNKPNVGSKVQCAGRS